MLNRVQKFTTRYLFQVRILLYLFVAVLAGLMLLLWQFQYLDKPDDDLPTPFIGTNFNQRDTVQIRIFQRKARAFLLSYPDSARYFSEEALRLSLNSSDQWLIAKSYQLLGNYYWVIAQSTDALRNYSIALKKFRELKDQTEVARTLTNLAFVYRKTTDFDKAIQMLFEALKIAEDLGLLEMQGKLWNNLGIMYKQQGNFRDAIKTFLESSKTYPSKSFGHILTTTMFLFIIL